MSKLTPRPAGRYTLKGIDINLDGQKIKDGESVELTSEQATRLWKHISAEAKAQQDWPTLQNAVNEGDVLSAENTILKEQNAALQNELALAKEQINQLTQAPINKEPSAPVQAPEPKEGKKAK